MSLFLQKRYLELGPLLTFKLSWHPIISKHYLDYSIHINITASPHYLSRTLLERPPTPKTSFISSDVYPHFQRFAYHRLFNLHELQSCRESHLWHAFGVEQLHPQTAASQTEQHWTINKRQRPQGKPKLMMNVGEGHGPDLDCFWNCRPGDPRIFRNLFWATSTGSGNLKSRVKKLGNWGNLRKLRIFWENWGFFVFWGNLRNYGKIESWKTKGNLTSILFSPKKWLKRNCRRIKLSAKTGKNQ
jgi:hypothetical protein